MKRYEINVNTNVSINWFAVIRRQLERDRYTLNDSFHFRDQTACFKRKEELYANPCRPRPDAEELDDKVYQGKTICYLQILVDMSQ